MYNSIYYGGYNIFIKKQTSGFISNTYYVKQGLSLWNLSIILSFEN